MNRRLCMRVLLACVCVAAVLASVAEARLGAAANAAVSPLRPGQTSLRWTDPSSGRLYDFSSLGGQDWSGVQKGYDRNPLDYEIIVHPGARVTDPRCSPTMVCILSNGRMQDGFFGSDYAWKVWLNDQGKQIGVVAMFNTDGYPAGSAQLYFTCPSVAGSSPPQYLGTVTRFYLPTALACAGGSPVPPPQPQPRPAPQPAACKWTSPQGLTYDFSSLAANDFAFAPVSTIVGQISTVLRVCGGAVRQASCAGFDASASVCQLIRNVPNPIASVSSPSTWGYIDARQPGAGVQLTVQGPFTCAGTQPYQSFIQLACATTTGPMSAQVSANGCAWTYSIATPLGCSGSAARPRLMQLRNRVSSSSKP